jgi:hypothetical protein
VSFGIGKAERFFSNGERINDQKPLTFTGRIISYPHQITFHHQCLFVGIFPFFNKVAWQRAKAVGDFKQNEQPIFF